LTPSVGSRGYEETFRNGVVLKSVGGKPVEEYQYDGNHLVATADPRPWRRQMNLLLSYLSFYNPINLVRALPRIDKLWAERIVLQFYGMFGLAKSAVQLRKWVQHLIAGPIERFTELGPPKFRMVVPETVDTRLAHYGAGTRLPVLV
jgi:hypothetical protein